MSTQTLNIVGNVANNGNSQEQLPCKQTSPDMCEISIHAKMYYDNYYETR